MYGIKKIWASLLILGPLSSPLIFSFSCVVIESMSTQLSCHRESQGIFAEALGPCAGGPAFKGRDPAVPSESVPSP